MGYLYSLSIVQEFTVKEFEGLESKAGYIFSGIPNTSYFKNLRGPGIGLPNS
jgi:hypothetical protein